MKCRSRLTIALLAMSVSTLVAAQTSSAPPKAADAGNPAPTTAYRSVFDTYVSANEDKPVAWRDANALVKEIGGWRVYARESQQSAPTSSASPVGRSSAPHEKH